MPELELKGMDNIPVTHPGTSLPFIELMFDYIWERKPYTPSEADLAGCTLQGAITLLQDVTRLSREDLAKRMLVTIPQFNNISARGRPITIANLERLTMIAGEHEIYSLYDFFYRQTEALKRRGRRRLYQSSGRG